MRRKVLKGVDANAHLSELSTERQLHKRYVEQDAESAELGVGAVYLENAREHKKEEAVSAEAHEPAKENSTKKRVWTTSPALNIPGAAAKIKSDGMTPDKAYEILEPQDEAGARAVTEAHRRLMQKLHPDRGGTNYLAAKINPIKDLLLAR